MSDFEFVDNFIVKILLPEIKELESSLKKVPSCKLHFPSTSALHNMELTVSPVEGIYKVCCFLVKIMSYQVISWMSVVSFVVPVVNYGNEIEFFYMMRDIEKNYSFKSEKSDFIVDYSTVCWTIWRNCWVLN